MSHHYHNMDANSADNTANYRSQSNKSAEGEHLSVALTAGQFSSTLSSVEQAVALGESSSSSSFSSSSAAATANPRAPFQTHSRHCCSLQRSRGVRDVRVICGGGRYPIGSAGTNLISWPSMTSSSSMLQRSSPPQMITPPAPHNSPVHHQPVASGPMIVCPTPNLIASAPASSACSSSSSLFSFSSSSEVSSPSTSSTSLSSSLASSVSSGETLEMDELVASSLDYRLHQLQIGSALSKLAYARNAAEEMVDEGAGNDGDKVNEEEGSSATKRRKKAAIDALEDIDEDDEDYENDGGFMMISQDDDQLKMEFLKGD